MGAEVLTALKGVIAGLASLSEGKARLADTRRAAVVLLTEAVTATRTYLRTRRPVAARAETGRL